MNKINYITIGALVFAVIALGVGLLIRAPIVNIEPIVNCSSGQSDCLGANPGSDFTNTAIFHDGLMMGNKIYATSTTDTTATLLAANLIDTSIINFTPSVISITLTLPATSTLKGFLKSSGSFQRTYLCNATTTTSAFGAFTLTAGTGMNLHQATSTLIVENGDCAILDFIRNTDTDIEVYYDLGY